MQFYMRDGARKVRVAMNIEQSAEILSTCIRFCEYENGKYRSLRLAGRTKKTTSIPSLKA
jgi:hypothetical protein